MAKFVDITLRLIDEMTQPMKSAVATFEAQSKQMIRTGKFVQSVGKNITSTGVAMTATATAGIGAFFATSAKEASNFESAMSQVAATKGFGLEELHTEGSRAQKEIKKLTDLALHYGATTKFTSLEVADAINTLSLAGLSTTEIEQALGGILDAAAAGNLEIDATSSYALAAIKGYGDEVANISKYNDLVAKGSSVANTDFEQLYISISEVASMANSFGQSQEELTKTMLMFAEQNITGSEAATAYSAMLAQVYAPTTEAKKALDALNVSAYDSNGNFRDFTDVINDLNVAMSSKSAEEAAAYQKAIFGKTHIADYNALIATSVDKQKKFEEALDDSGGAAAKMAAVQLDNLVGQLTLLSSAWTSFKIALGNKLLPYIKKLVSFLSGLTDKLNSLSEEQLDSIVKILAAIAAIGPILIVLGKVITMVGTIITLVGKFAKMMQLIKGGATIAKGFITAFGAGGVAGVVIAVIAIIAVLAYVIYKNWDKIKPVLVAIWEKTKEVFGAIANFLVETFTAIGQFFVAVWDGIKQTFTSVVDFIKSIFIARITAYVSIIVNVFNSLKDSFTAIFDGVKQIFSGIIDFITGVFTGNWQKAWEGVKEIFGGIFNSFAALVKTPINAVIAIINGAIAGINKINVKVPDWVPGLGGKNFGFNIPEIPALAVGTDNWTGGLAQISERGGEIVDLPSGSRVYPHDESVQKAYTDGARSNGNITISIPKIADSVVIREDADIDKLVNKLANQLTQAASSLGTSSMSSMGRATGTLAATGTM